MSELTPNAILPEKSKKYYEKVYDTFVTWKKDNNATSTSEAVLLAYFNKLSVSNKPTSLWTYYSLLRSTISLYEGINIEQYAKLLTFLKHKSKGFQPKQACVFTSDEINAFFNAAPDGEYLPTKVALIMGVMGACRTTEMYDMKIKDIEDHDTALIVNIPRTSVYKPRKFTVTARFYEKCRKYLNGRSEGTNVYVFHQYRNSKITKQRIGICSFRRMARNIAVYLKLDDAEKYSGHSLRRSSERIFVESGGDLTSLTPWIPATDLLLNHRNENGHNQFASTPAPNEMNESASGKFEFVDIFKDMESSEEEADPPKPLEPCVEQESSEGGEEEEDEDDQVIKEAPAAKPAPPIVDERSIRIEEPVGQDQRDIPPLILSNCTNCTFNITINNYFDGKKA